MQKIKVLSTAIRFWFRYVWCTDPHRPVVQSCFKYALLPLSVSIGLVSPLGAQRNRGWGMPETEAPPPSPLYARLSGALHPRGSPKNRGVVSACHRFCPISGFQRLLTTCGHLPSSFFNTTRHTIWLRNLDSWIFSSRKSTVKNTSTTISWRHWTPGDHVSKHCFLYYNELWWRQWGEKIELINPAGCGTMNLKCESWGVKSWFISLITPLWSLYLIPLDLKRN